MSTPINSIPLETEDTQQQSGELKNISADLIKRNGMDVRKTIENFFNETAARAKRGEAPNADFGLVAQDLTMLLPHYEELEMLQKGKTLSGASIYNNLMYDSMNKMNEILGNYVYELPNPIQLTPEQEMFGIKQALIELQNKFPHVRDVKTREAILWNINKLNSIILGEAPQGATGNVNPTK